MIDKKLFNYYTGIKFTVMAKDFNAVSSKRHKELIRLSAIDVEAGKQIRNKKEFKNNSEYNLYLCALSETAYRLSLGLSPYDYYVND